MILDPGNEPLHGAVHRFRRLRAACRAGFDCPQALLQVCELGLGQRGHVAILCTVAFLSEPAAAPPDRHQRTGVGQGGRHPGDDVPPVDDPVIAKRQARSDDQIVGTGPHRARLAKGAQTHRHALGKEVMRGDMGQGPAKAVASDPEHLARVARPRRRRLRVVSNRLVSVLEPAMGFAPRGVGADEAQVDEPIGQLIGAAEREDHDLFTFGNKALAGAVRHVVHQLQPHVLCKREIDVALGRISHFGQGREVESAAHGPRAGDKIFFK